MRHLLTRVLAFACFAVVVGYIMHIAKNKPHRDRGNPQQPTRQELMLADREHTLLAVKYGLQPTTAKDIIVDYDLALYGVSTLDFDRQDAVFPEATSTAEIITSLSSKYDVSAATIASLLVAHEIMQIPEYERSEQDARDYEHDLY